MAKNHPTGKPAPGHAPAGVRVSTVEDDTGPRTYVYVPEAVPIRRSAAGEDDRGGIIDGGVIRIDLGTGLVLNLAVFAADDLITAISTRAPGR